MNGNVSLENGQGSPRRRSRSRSRSRTSQDERGSFERREELKQQAARRPRDALGRFLPSEGSSKSKRKTSSPQSRRRTRNVEQGSPRSSGRARSETGEDGRGSPKEIQRKSMLARQMPRGANGRFISRAAMGMQGGGIRQTSGSQNVQGGGMTTTGARRTSSGSWQSSGGGSRTGTY